MKEQLTEEYSAWWEMSRIAQSSEEGRREEGRREEGGGEEGGGEEGGGEEGRRERKALFYI